MPGQGEANQRRIEPNAAIEPRRRAGESVESIFDIAALGCLATRVVMRRLCVMLCRISDRKRGPNGIGRFQQVHATLYFASDEPAWASGDIQNRSGLQLGDAKH